VKIRANSLKIREKLCPECFDWKKMVPQITWRPFFRGHPKNGLHEKIFAQEVAQNFFGRVWGNSGKNLLHPQKFACSYTHVKAFKNRAVHSGFRKQRTPHLKILWVPRRHYISSFDRKRKLAGAARLKQSAKAGPAVGHWRRREITRCLSSILQQNYSIAL